MDQFKLRRSSCVTDVINLVIDVTKAILEEDKCCAMKTFRIAQSYGTKLGGPKYMMQINVNYLIDMLLYCRSAEGRTSYRTTCGAPQGSISIYVIEC